ncbi:LPE10 [Candida oxycetoniae]|uniref:Magnesium transporter n=1 Tax=Candida oxycetoniae TaxID=497107 RepID=A0AAI9SWV9_9ASCO|nr:LPE10 [Candida oxycetoniae]KAI3404237.2 LPE10 [Candida oxycetoniae]
MIPRVSRFINFFGICRISRRGVCSSRRFLLPAKSSSEAHHRHHNRDQRAGTRSKGDSFEDLFISKTLSSSSTKNADSELIKCTVFDAKGDMVCHGKDIPKSEFMKQYHLVPRDFRKISKHSTSATATKSPSLVLHNIELVPSLVTRKSCIMLNLLNIRALIQRDKVTIFGSNASASTPSTKMHESRSQLQFLHDLGDKLKTKPTQHQEGGVGTREGVGVGVGVGEALGVGEGELYYEFRALEAILMHVIANLTTEMKVHHTVVTNILESLDESIERFKLRYLLIQSKKLASFEQKVTLIRDLLEDLLERDDELNDMYLTDSRTGTNHAEVEMLLESYYKHADEIVQTVGNLRSQIKTTEEIINVLLDSNRNELMLLGLKFSTGLLSMGIALYLAALYGMNLENFIEETDNGFECVIVVSTLALFALLFITRKQLKKVEKITMTTFKDGNR